MFRILLKAAVVLVLLALIWKLFVSEDDIDAPQ